MTMDEGYVSVGRVIASVLWGWVLALITTAWMIVIFAPQHWLWAGGFFATACASSAVAATMHIRTFAVKMCAMIRSNRAALERHDAAMQGPRSID